MSQYTAEPIINRESDKLANQNVEPRATQQVRKVAEHIRAGREVVAKGSVMRIKVDLSDFLQDERKFSVLKVKPKETKTVQDVISKISYLFNVYGKEGEDGNYSRGFVWLSPTLQIFVNFANF